MNVLIIVSAGLICGFLSSSPLGTINLWIINQTLKHQKNIIWFLIGVVSADCWYAGLAAWGYHTLISDSAVGKWITFTGGAFLILLGILSFRLKHRASDDVPRVETTNPLKQWALGFFMCGTNPAFLLFWIFAISSMEKNLDLRVVGSLIEYLLIGIAVGDLLWFALLITLVKKFREKISEKVSTTINRAIAVVFMVIGALGMLQVV